MASYKSLYNEVMEEGLSLFLGGLGGIEPLTASLRYIEAYRCFDAAAGMASSREEAKEALDFSEICAEQANEMLLQIPKNAYLL